MDMEFKTTQQRPSEDPEPPPGDGWTLGGACPSTERSWMVCMYWQRLKKHESKSCKQCNAVAFLEDGRCVGCGTPHEE